MTYRKGICLFKAVLALIAFPAAFSPLAAQNGAPKPPVTETPAAPVLQVEPEAVRSPVGPPPVVTDVPTPPVVAPAPVPKPPKKKGPTDSLRPGQYVWEQRDNYARPLKIVVILDIQRLYVFDNGSLVAFSTISSGKKGKETPTGDFTILQKNIDHKSNLYSDAPMPFMQRLTWDGIALHAGKNPGFPASHGCIRLPPNFAKALFGITKMDDRVVVLKDISTPAPPKPVVPPKVEPPVEVVPPTLPVEPVAVVVPAKKG